MEKKEQIDNILRSRNGYLLSKDVIGLGISKAYLYEYIKKHELKRVAHGIYMSDDVWQDDMFILCLKNPRGILSHETALMLHGLTEREASRIHMTVPAGYNATHLRSKGVDVHQTQKLSLGASKAKTVFGNIVTAYDKERTICDIVKGRDKLDSQMFQVALREFVKCSDKNMGKLMRYSKELAVEKEVQKYMEVLL